MSSATPTRKATEAEHRLTVAEGLLSSIDSPRSLTATRRFLGVDELAQADAPAALEAEIARLRPVVEAESAGDTATIDALTAAGVVQVRPRPTPRARKRRRKEKTMEEARVTGNPPVDGSPSSQTGGTGAQNEPWGGPNAAALQADSDDAWRPAVPSSRPPNLREAAGWECCGNCVFFLKGCNLYGWHRDGDKPNLAEGGAFPVDADDLCDSHMTLTPEVQRRTDQLDGEDSRLAEAARAENGQAVVRARARVATAERRLDEAIDRQLEEMWSDEARAAALLARKAHRHGMVPGRSEGRHMDKFGSELLTRDAGESALHYTMRRLRDKPQSAGVGIQGGKALYHSKLGANHVRPRRTLVASATEESFSEIAHPRTRGGKWAMKLGDRVQHRADGSQGTVQGPEDAGRIPVKFHTGDRDPSHVFKVRTEDLESLERPGKMRESVIEEGALPSGHMFVKSVMHKGQSVTVSRKGSSHYGHAGGKMSGPHKGSKAAMDAAKKLCEALGEGRGLSEVSSDAYPGLDRSPKKNWVDKAGGLPRYIERIAKHLHYEKGKDIGHAIAIAVNVVKKMCASGDTNFPGKQNVNPKARAEACAAVAEWEKKKGATSPRGVAGNVARAGLKESAQLAEFAALLEVTEAVYRPVPPSWPMIEKLHAEIAEADGPDWMAGFAALDEALELIDKLGFEEAAEQLDEAVLTRLGVHFDPRKHPRMAKGRRGGGRFSAVLDKLHTDMAGHRHTSAEQLRAARQGRQLPSLTGAGQGGLGRTAPVFKQGDEFLAADSRRYRVTHVRPSGKVRAVDVKSGADTGWQKPDVAWTPGTVEQHFAMAGKHQQGSAAPADLTVDMAIGGVLSSFPNVKNWKLDEPTQDAHGKKSWLLHVELADGKEHHISVNEDGQVEIAKAAKPKPPKPAAAAPASGYEATGDVNVVSHMQPGTVYKGADGHLYKHHGDDWIAGKKGPVKGAHIENLDTGVHKTVPYFAIHGKEYPIWAPAGSFEPKAAGTPSSSSDVFGALMKSVADQHGSLSSVAGKNVVVTGTIPGHTRNAVHALITAAGGTPHSSIASNTHVLVTGDKVGATKINAAKKKGVTVIPWDEFKHLVEAEYGFHETAYALVCGDLEEATASRDIVRLRARRDALEEKVYSAEQRRQHATVGDDRYPIGDKAHALAALERLNQGGLSPAEKAKVIAKAARYLGSAHTLVKRRKGELDA